MGLLVLLGIGTLGTLIYKITQLLHYYKRHKRKRDRVDLASLTFKQFLAMYNADPDPEKHWKVYNMRDSKHVFLNYNDCRDSKYVFLNYNDCSSQRPINSDIVFNFIDFMRFQCWYMALEKKRRKQSLIENALSISRQVQTDMQKAQKREQEECQRKLEELLNKDNYTPNLTLEESNDFRGLLFRAMQDAIKRRK